MSRTQMTYPSLVGYREHVLSGKATSQCDRILACFFESAVPLTRLQVSQLTRIRLSSVCGRVNTLLYPKKGDPLLRVTHEAIDPSTGRLAAFLEPVWPMPVQAVFRWPEG
jgi:hypothetical protein